MFKLLKLGDISYVLHSIIPLRWMFILVRIHGRLLYLIRYKKRVVIRNNILESFGKIKSEKEINLMTRRFFEYNQLRELLIALLPKMTSLQLSELFSIEGLEHLDRAFSQDKGVILIGSHLNSVCTFIAIYLLREKGYNVRVAMPKEGDPYAPTPFRKIIYKFLGKKETFIDQTGAFFAQFNIRPIVWHLSNKEAVLLMGDGLHSVDFAEVEFLDRLVPFATGAMNIARLTGSPVVPLFVLGSPPDKLRIVIEKPIEQGNSQNSE
ncbi:MAG: lysophospholipid acyltransferase family protein, partial [Thermodesulfobacteriota bacterium]